MLSKVEVDEQISAGHLAIEYSYGLMAGEGVQEKSAVDLSNPTARSSEDYERNFFGNRLSVTLGPIVLSHNHRRARGRRGYKNFPNTFDLRQSDNSFVLKAGESITVNTVESISLGPRLGALTLPRVSHASSGIILSPSYIDPLWSGILVLEMTNVSREPFTLRIGEKIGAVHFYEVDKTALHESDRPKFVTKSHHYGLAWPEILTSDRPPIPLRKRSQGDTGTLRSLARFLGTNWRSIATAGGLGTAVFALLWAGGVARDLASLPQLTTQQQETADQLVDATARLDELEGSQLVTGNVTVLILAGEEQVFGTQAYDVPEGFRPTGIVASLPLGTEQFGIRATVSTGRTDGVVQIDYAITSNSTPLSNQQIVFSFVLVEGR